MCFLPVLLALPLAQLAFTSGRYFYEDGLLQALSVGSENPLCAKEAFS